MILEPVEAEQRQLSSLRHTSLFEANFLQGYLLALRNADTSCRVQRQYKSCMADK